eukprot:scaffold10470_cov124-Isochrysis_galbana.AAC.5
MSATAVDSGAVARDSEAGISSPTTRKTAPEDRERLTASPIAPALRGACLRPAVGTATSTRQRIGR